MLSFRGMAIANNSFVNRSEIGDSDDYNSALHCTTNNVNCCNVSNKGDWYFPNGTQLQIIGTMSNVSNDSYYVNRDVKLIRLIRKGSPPESGRFHCEIPDANNNSLRVFVNIGMYSK